MNLAPFWRYYGGKNRAAKMYPAPAHDTIIEPFAGCAGYSHNHPHKKVILVDANPVICGIWSFLIASSPQDILSLPDIPQGGTVDDLDCCQEARWLAGFWCNSGTTTPRKRPSTYAKYDVQAGWVGGWSDKTRRRIANQVGLIKHWVVIHGDYTAAPDIEATYFVDPPYNNKAGQKYPFQPESFEALGQWCQTRQGFVIVCENEGADWLPFEPLATVKNLRGTGSKEVVWYNQRHTTPQQQLFGEDTQ